MPSIEKKRTFSAAAQHLGIDPGRLDAVLGNAPFGVYVDHPTDGAVFANDYLLELFGIPWSEFAGFGWARHIAASDRERLTQRIGEFKQTRARIDVQYRVNRPDGQRWVRAYVEAIVDEDGRHVGSVGLVSDVTELRQARAGTADRQRLETIGRFAARVAHDFNNNLGAMLLVADQLRDLHPTGDEAELLSLLHTSIDQAASVTRQLLTLARTQHTHAAQVCDANAALVQMTPLLQSTLGETTELEMQLDESGAWVPLSTAQLGQIVVNLATNARDAVKGNGRVQIRTRNDGGDWSIEVRDDGEGIAPENRDQIFAPFFTTKDVGRGTGLGLSIVHDLVEVAHGRIDVQSQPGAGTAVTIVLPTVQATRPSSGKGRRVAPLASSNILLVEDNDSLRQALSYALAIRGHTVRAARTLAEAEERLVEWDAVEILVTDALLPDGNGIDLAWRWLEEKADLLVVVISGYPGRTEPLPDSHHRAAYLPKPFGHQQLLEAISELRSKNPHQ